MAFLGIQLVAWMHTVGAVAVVVSQTDSPLVIALIQTSVSLPAVLLAVLSGALADRFDRDDFLRAAAGTAALALALTAALTFAGTITVVQLLSLTLLVGAAVAAALPAVQAATPQVVVPAELYSAMTLNGVAINLARVGGPALAGATIALTDPAVLFAMEGALALVVAVLVSGLPIKRPAHLVRERLGEAMVAGVVFAGRSVALRTILSRAFLYTICASALWALVPVVAVESLGLSASGFGYLFGCIGAGALLAAWLLPRAARSWSTDSLMIASSVLGAVGLGSLALVNGPAPAAICLVASGAGWMVTLTALSTSAQLASADWVRARTMAYFLFALQAGLALGSFLWGAVAAAASLDLALGIAAAGVAAGILWAVLLPITTDPNPASSAGEVAASAAGAPR